MQMNEYEENEYIIQIGPFVFGDQSQWKDVEVEKIINESQVVSNGYRKDNFHRKTTKK